MEFLKNITTPLRKRNIYSSKRQLMDAEASSNHESEDVDGEISNHVTSKTSPVNPTKSYKLTMQALQTKSIDDETSSERTSPVNIHLKKVKTYENECTTNDINEREGSQKNSLFIKKHDVLSSLSESLDILKKKKTDSSSFSSRSNENTSNKESNIFKLPSKISPSKQKITRAKNKTSSSSKSDLKNDDGMELKTLSKKSKNSNRSLKLIGIHVLKSELFKNHPFSIYPFVKMHIVDFEDGLCMNLNKLICTKPFDLVKNRTLTPQWNEILLFEDTVIENIKKSANVIIFFEVMDFSNQDTDGHNTIAWAFIKPFGNNGFHNINRKLKLQLYEILDSTIFTNISRVYDCWKNKPWKIYPSILHVTLKGIKIQEEQNVINNMKLNLFNIVVNNENEIGSIPLSTEVKTEIDAKYEKRKSGQHCKLPNKILKYLPNIEKGSFIVRFSNCGKYLAFSGCDKENFVIYIYSVPHFEKETSLLYHKKPIYDIGWHFTKIMLLTASADYKVCVWDLANTKKVLMQKLEHPAFVYSSQFCPLENIIVTGCYDKIVRIWVQTNNTEFDLKQELSGHEGFVNSVCFVKKGKAFYSGDSTGLIIKWNHNTDNWLKCLIIKDDAIGDCIINDLVMFPDNQRMLVVLRNSLSWVLDVITSTSLLCLKDGFEYRYQLRGSISSCGNFIFIGNCAWNSSGNLLAIYNPSIFHHQTITAFDFHPYYNFSAMGCGFLTSPLLICEYKANFQDKNISIEYFRDFSHGESPNVINYEDYKSLEKTVENENHLQDLKTIKFKRLGASNEGLNKNLIQKINDSKLWNLINKMDDVLLVAKKGRQYSERKSNALKNSVDQKTKEENSIIFSESANLSNATISVDLSQLNQIFQLRADVHMVEGETSDDVRSEHTYLVNKNSAEDIKQLTDDSTTLSAAESLEDDDTHTYTIPFNDILND